MPQVKSRSELTQKVICPAPSRAREQDDQIVEVFLQAFQSGRFARNPDWLPQHVTNVEVIAAADDGTRLAIEHTRVFSFDGQQEQEKILRPVAEALESVKLPGVSDRWYQVSFTPNLISRELGKHRSVVLEELSRWALRVLPGLVPRDYFTYPLTIPIMLPGGKSVNIQVGVEVWDGMQVEWPIFVGGSLPEGDRLVTAVRRALGKKLPKLAAVEADLRFLMIDQPTVTDSDNALLKVIRDVAPEYPLIQKIQAVVAKTFGFQTEKVIFFVVWDIAAEVWSEYLQASIRQ